MLRTRIPASSHHGSNEEASEQIQPRPRGPCGSELLVSKVPLPSYRVPVPGEFSRCARFPINLNFEISPSLFPIIFTQTTNDNAMEVRLPGKREGNYSGSVATPNQIDQHVVRANKHLFVEHFLYFTSFFYAFYSKIRSHINTQSGARNLANPAISSTGKRKLWNLSYPRRNMTSFT